jgi:hypothetical protein
VSCSAVEFADGLGDGEAVRDADEGGPYGLADQFGYAARVVMFLRLGEGRGLGDRDDVELSGLPGGDLVAAPLRGKRWIRMESKFPGWSPSPVSTASVQPGPEVRRRVGRLSTPRRGTWHSPGAAWKSLPARRSITWPPERAGDQAGS